MSWGSGNQVQELQNKTTAVFALYKDLVPNSNCHKPAASFRPTYGQSSFTPAWTSPCSCDLPDSFACMRIQIAKNGQDQWKPGGTAS